MKLEPKSLEVPLFRRNWSGLWFALASIVCAWFWHKPTDVLGIAISGLVGGITFWMAIGPGLNFLKYHRSPAVRLVTFLTVVGGAAFVMQTVIPSLNSFFVSLR